MNWQRPEAIPFPNVWARFDGLREINGQIPKFWIQDVTDDIEEEVMSTMLMGFAKEEPLCKYSKLAEDPISVAEATELYRYLVRNKLTVVCLTNGPEGSIKVAGISCLTRITTDDPHLEFKGECLRKLKDLVEYAFSVKDPFIHFGVDECLSDRGIYVSPDFRGQGICNEFLQSWVAICKAVGLKVVVGSFTSIVSQKVADRAGFGELNSFAYADLEKVNANFKLDGIQEHTKNLRLLYKLV